MAGRCEGDASGLKRYDLTVPPNATAEVILPAGAWREGGKPLEGHTYIRNLHRENGKVRFEIGSGDYRFRVV
jgi:alpha-L-rhamnosidase